MKTRRDFLMQSGMATAAALLVRGALLGQQSPAASSAVQNSPAQPNTNPAVPPHPTLPDQLRTAPATESVRTTKLTDTIFLLQSVGGSIVCQIGPDGKVLIDSGISTV